MAGGPRELPGLEPDPVRVSDTYLPSGLPAPAPDRDGVDAEFWEAARRHQLARSTLPRLRHLPGARRVGLPSLPLARPGVGGDGPGRGSVFSWIRVHHAAHPALRQALPYLVVLVELADTDGVRMIGNLLGPADQEVAIGDAVEAVFETTRHYTLVQWQKTELPSR